MVTVYFDLPLMAELDLPDDVEITPKILMENKGEWMLDESVELRIVDVIE